MLMTVTEYARHRGCALNAVLYAVKQGRVEREADGRIESDRADHDWEKNTLHTNARYGPKPKREDAPKPAATHARRRAAAEAENGGDPVRGLDFSKARAAKEIYEARIKKLEWEERVGSLVSKKAVQIEAFNSFRILRDACFNIPDRIASQIAAETDPQMVHQLLLDELRHVFDDFSSRDAGKEEAVA
jgi:hypothetical protein